MPSNTTAPPAKKKGRRARLIVLVLALALVAGVGFGGYWGVSTVRASFPQTTGELRLDSLSGEVEVKRDAYGVPQIYADTEADLFRAQGYVQAQDRFYEMDVRRHMTAGRLSEMFGKSQVDTDAFLRTLGWRQVAQQEYDKVLSAETKKNLQAYAEGVNAYLKGRDTSDISVEYAALALTGDYTIEPWTPVDSVAWLKAMAWDLRGNMQDEIDRSLMTSRLSAAQIKQLYPAYPTDLHQPIVQSGAVDKESGKFDPKASASKNGDGTGSDSGSGSALQGMQSQLGALSDSLDEIPALLGPNGNGIGSNSWVVSGQYTTSGKPLLANDPHLAPMLPSLWYQMGLHCRSVSATCRYDVSGYTFSGTPGVIIGHNDTVAWGLTNLGADVTDLYLEKVSDKGYVVDGKVKPFTVRDEIIKVAGGGDRKITIRSTGHGPLVSDRSSELEKVGQKAPVGNAAPDRGNGYAVSLQWTALQPGRSMDAIFQLNRAKNFKEFRAAAENFEVPSQNLIYADAENIGYQAPGRIPVRAKGDGTVPAPGWDSRYKWKGYIPYDELPYELNPDRGYIVTANQAVVDKKKYPYLLTEDWGYGSRSQRINDLVESKIKDGGKISPDDMRTMQMDNRSEIATLLNPLLLKIDISDPYVREAQKLLEGWDYTQEPDSAAAAYFNAVWRNVLKLAFGDKLPKELRAEDDCISVRPADLTGLPVDEQNKRVRECGERDADTAQPDGGDRWYEVVRPLLKQENSEWWKTEANRTDQATETRDQLLARAMEDARWELTAKLGKDVSTWSWGRLHQLTLQNQTLGTAGPGFVQSLLNRGPWNLGGGEAAVNATGWNAAGGYGVVWVPSMRMVVNVGDWDRSRWINLSGASGHAYHDNYTDQTDKWVKGELLDWPFGKAAVDASTKDTLLLKP
ncbi:penicillin acylase family protein [Streptomyces sp. NPDC026092]|uniref:penicillin acylase family protein n=1 Tax=Streptomyces sp. NPDC026092 TaxID=3154797 RepID=UPI00340A1881